MSYVLSGGTSSLTTNLASMGTSGGVMGPLSSSLGTSMIPPTSYTQSAISNTTFSNPSALTSFNNPTFTNPVSNTLPQYPLPYSNPMTTTFTNNNVTFSNPLSSQFNSLPLTGGTITNKLKQIEDVDLGKETPVLICVFDFKLFGIIHNAPELTYT